VHVPLIVNPLGHSELPLHCFRIEWYLGKGYEEIPSHNNPTTLPLEYVGIIVAARAFTATMGAIFIADS